MKVVKPGKLSVITRCFEHGRRHFLGVSVLAWLDTMFPGLAADADWGIFNLASRDQQRQGWWAPDEAYRFDNMHPSQPVIEGRLPGYVARAFINRRVRQDILDERGQPTGEESVSERFTEVPLALGG